MFLVFNKEKISSYIVLLSIILILFGVAVGIRDNKVIETGANHIENDIKLENENIQNITKNNYYNSYENICN